MLQDLVAETKFNLILSIQLKMPGIEDLIEVARTQDYLALI